ncbi:R3H domain-containing protein 2-like isoform X4 [Ischnura elegans]|uniref:R3H domain-containing protein 2-like isoform X4 n=1 Tax=Ischnura elegans TaxID=197161 RepID=UPI001ED8A6BB|nr:R3H domain-containing protein 2-like isoform X4 [Ischnura elegans]
MSDMAKLEIPSIVVHNGTTGGSGGGGGGGGGSPTGSGGGVVVVVGPRGHNGSCPRAMDHEQRVGGPRSGGPSLRKLRTLSKQEEFEEEDELALENCGLGPIDGPGPGGSGGGWRGSRDGGGGSSGDERGAASPSEVSNGLEEGGCSARGGSERRKGFQAKQSRTSSSGDETQEVEGPAESSEGPKKPQTPISRMRSNSKVKLLVRSHAMREETSPPPDPEAVHRYSPPASGAITVPLAPTSPSALSIPPSSLLNVNVGNTGGTSRPSSRHRLRHQGSSQGSMDSSSPCLSRDSSTEQASLLDGSSSSGGGGSSGDLQQFIVETLNRNYKDRMLMLKIEQEIVSLARDNKRTHHKFPPMSSYQRMLVHRVAAFLGMEHNVDSTGNAVVVSKGRLNSNGNGNSSGTGGANSSSCGGSDGPNSPSSNHSSSLSPSSSSSASKARFAAIEPCLRDHIRDELLPEEPRRSILKRGDSSSFEDGAGPFKSPERQLSSESRRSKSFEEREEEYEKARKRIFNQDEGICCCDSSGQRCSHEELHCWSGVGGGNGGGGGGGSGGGSFLHPWSSSDSSDTPHGSRGRHNQLRPSRLLKVESFESRDSLRRTSSGLRPSVSKSYSFGGYSGSVGGNNMGSGGGGGGSPFTRDDSISSTQSAGGCLLTKQDSSASSANSAHLSPSSSGYKSQSIRSDSSNTPSPSPTTLALTPSSHQQQSSHDQSQGPSPSPPLLSPPLHNQTHSESQTSPSPCHSPQPSPRTEQGTTADEELTVSRRTNTCSSQTRGTSPLPPSPAMAEISTSHSVSQTVGTADATQPTLGSNAVMWAVTSMESVPPGSILINPQVPFYYMAPVGLGVNAGGVTSGGGVMDAGGGAPSLLPLSAQQAATAPPPPMQQPPPHPPPPQPASVPALPSALPSVHPQPNPPLPPQQQHSAVPHHPSGQHHMGSASVQGSSQAPCIMYQQYLQSTPPPPAPPPPPPPPPAAPSMVQQVVGVGGAGTTPYPMVQPPMVPQERQPLISSRPFSQTPFTMVGGGTSGAFGNGGGSGIIGGGGDCYLPNPSVYSTLPAPSGSSGTIPYYAQGAYQQPSLPPPNQGAQLNQHNPTSQHQAMVNAMVGQAYHSNQPTSQIRCPTPPQHLSISSGHQMYYSQPPAQPSQLALSFLSGSSAVGNNASGSNAGNYYASAGIQPHLLTGGPPGTPPPPPPTGGLLPTPTLPHPPSNPQINPSTLVPNQVHQQLQHQHHYIPPMSMAPSLGLYHANMQMAQTPVPTPTTQHVGLTTSSANMLPPHHHAPNNTGCGSRVTPVTKSSPSSFQRPSQQFHRTIPLTPGSALSGGKAVTSGDATAFGLRFPSVHQYGVWFVPGGSGQHQPLPIPGSHAVRVSPFVRHATGAPNPQTFSPTSCSSPSSPVVLSAPNNPSASRPQRPHLTSGAPPKGRKQRTKSGASSSGGRSGSLSRQTSIDNTQPPTPSVPDKDGSDGDSIPALVASSFSRETCMKKPNVEGKETDCILSSESDIAFVNGPAKMKDGCDQGQRIIGWSGDQELEMSAVEQPRPQSAMTLLSGGIEVRDSMGESLVFERGSEGNEGRKDS